MDQLFQNIAQSSAVTKWAILVIALIILTGVGSIVYHFIGWLKKLIEKIKTVTVHGVKVDLGDDTGTSEKKKAKVPDLTVNDDVLTEIVKQCSQITEPFAERYAKARALIIDHQIDKVKRSIEQAISGLSGGYKTQILAQDKKLERMDDLLSILLEKDFNEVLTRKLSSLLHENTIHTMSDAQLDQCVEKYTQESIAVLHDRFLSYPSPIDVHILNTLFTSYEARLQNTISGCLREARQLSFDGQKDLIKERQDYERQLSQILKTALPALA